MGDTAKHVTGFFDLPLEIREMIYGFIFCRPKVHKYEVAQLQSSSSTTPMWAINDPSHPWQRAIETNLLRVNRQIYHEAGHVLFSQPVCLVGRLISGPDIWRGYCFDTRLKQLPPAFGNLHHLIIDFRPNPFQDARMECFQKSTDEIKSGYSEKREAINYLLGSLFPHDRTVTAIERLEARIDIRGREPIFDTSSVINTFEGFVRGIPTSVHVTFVVEDWLKDWFEVVTKDVAEDVVEDVVESIFEKETFMEPYDWGNSRELLFYEEPGDDALPCDANQVKETLTLQRKAFVEGTHASYSNTPQSIRHNGLKSITNFCQPFLEPQPLTRAEDDSDQYESD